MKRKIRAVTNDTTLISVYIVETDDKEYNPTGKCNHTKRKKSDFYTHASPEPTAGHWGEMN